MSSPLLQVEAAGPFFLRDIEQKSAALRNQIADLPKLGGVTPASRLEIRPAPETASCGIPQMDALIGGGLPRGCLTEVCGPESSGRTSLLLAALAAATWREEICTLIDASDAFDPHSAAAAGVNLERLLWIRCGMNPSSPLSRRRRNAASREEQERRRMEDPVEQALRATDLLLESRGFGRVIMDLAGVPCKMARRIPLTTWFRFRRAVENTPTVLLVIGTQPCAQSCASLSVQLRTANRELSTGSRPSHAELLTGIEIEAEVLRSHTERKPVETASAFTTKTAWTA